MSKKTVKRSDKTVIKKKQILKMYTILKKCEKQKQLRKTNKTVINNKYKQKWQKQKNGKQINIKMANK